MPVSVTLPNEFHATHSMDGNPILVRRGDGDNNHEFRLYPDGARASVDWEMRTDPPTNRRQRLELEKLYYKVKAKQAETDFHKLKAAILGNGELFQWSVHQYGPAQPSRELALRHIHSIWLDARRKMARVDLVLLELPEVIAERQEEEARKRLQEELQQRSREEMNIINSITLDPKG